MGRSVVYLVVGMHWQGDGSNCSVVHTTLNHEAMVALTTVFVPLIYTQLRFLGIRHSPGFVRPLCIHSHSNWSCPLNSPHCPITAQHSGTRKQVPARHDHGSSSVGCGPRCLQTSESQGELNQPSHICLVHNAAPTSTDGIPAGIQG